MQLGDDDPTLGLFRVLRDDGSADPATDPFLPAETLRRMHREMLRIRLLDERMLARQRQGKVGFYGTVTGQEATPVAAALAIELHDWVFPALRESAMMLVRGFPLDRYLAQVYGNALDVLKGRMQPSHMAGRQVRQVSWSSCMASQLPQAVGAAYAMKLRGSREIAIGFVGDGGTSEPDFHVAMNFAAVWRVPVVIVCQNNHWAISVPSNRQTASATFAVKAHGYGMPGLRVDGNDVLAVYVAVRAAAERARSGGGPTFLEHVTYRIGAHSSSDDPTRYRAEAEVDAWRQRDPIVRFERYLRRAGLLDESGRARIEAELQDEIAAAIARVEAYGPPPRESLLEDVYATRPWHLEEQARALAASPPPRAMH